MSDQSVLFLNKKAAAAAAERIAVGTAESATPVLGLFVPVVVFPDVLVVVVVDVEEPEVVVVVEDCASAPISNESSLV